MRKGDERNVIALLPVTTGRWGRGEGVPLCAARVCVPTNGSGHVMEPPGPQWREGGGEVHD